MDDLLRTPSVPLASRRGSDLRDSCTDVRLLRVRFSSRHVIPARFARSGRHERPPPDSVDAACFARGSDLRGSCTDVRLLCARFLPAQSGSPLKTQPAQSRMV